MKPKIVLIVGPTASGKSQTAIELAGAHRGEIINADSQQVYRYMDIGTGKPTLAERVLVPHHLIDLVNPDEEFNVAMFRECAVAATAEIRARDHAVFVCGGTGLYIRALTQGLFAGPGQDTAIRDALLREVERHGLTRLYARLQQIDPLAVSWIHPNDRQRIIRALEIYELTGRPMSLWQREHGFSEAPFETLEIGMARDRAELYALIERRCDEMIAAGLLEEVKGLVARGYSLDLKPLQSVGYRHVGLYLTGAMALDEAVMLMKRDTRRLAKRQLTWFRKDASIIWSHPEREREKIERLVNDFLG